MEPESKSQMESSANSLRYVNAIVLAIALIGSVILIGFGIYGDCIDYCNCYPFCIGGGGPVREPNYAFIIVGVVGSLVSILTYQVIRIFGIYASSRSANK
jgi:hypothetical protein